MTSFPGESPLQIALLTISNRHTLETDDTGVWLNNALQQQGHQLYQRGIVKEDLYQIRAAVSSLIADAVAQVILLAGGTGFHAKNCTVEAIKPLFDREILDLASCSGPCPIKKLAVPPCNPVLSQGLPTKNLFLPYLAVLMPLNWQQTRLFGLSSLRILNPVILPVCCAVAALVVLLQ